MLNFVPVFGRPRGVFSAEADALFARMSTTPTMLRKRQIDRLIKRLKAAGVWTKLDALYVLAAANSNAALLNWVSTSFNLTATNSPTFTADRGYTFDGSTNYLATGINFTAGGLKYVDDNCSMFGWVHDQTAVSRSGANHDRLGVSIATVRLYSRNNFNANNETAIGTSVRCVGHTRTADANYIIYGNGAAVATITADGIAPHDTEVFIGAANLGGSIAGGAGGWRAWGCGSSLTAAEQLHVYNTLNEYMVAVGAV